MIAHVKPRSLVSTLFIRVAVLLGATIVAIGATAFWAAKHRIDEVYDSQLISGTKTLYALTKQELEDYESGVSDPDEATSTGPGQILDVEDRQAFETYQGWRMFRIWHAGRLVASSKNGPTHGGPPETTGFVDLAGAAGQWRTYRFLSKDNGLSIAVGEPLTVRYALIENIALTLVVPLVLLIPASAALIWLMLLDGLGALRRLATALETKSGSNLVPLSASQWPRDLGGVLTAINDLLGRLDRSFRQTLRFTDHAAHQLRTPLAGLKLNAQMIEAEKDPEEQRAIILRIREGAERAAALVEQLLTLARLDSGAFASSPHDVTAVAKSALGQLGNARRCRRRPSRRWEAGFPALPRPAGTPPGIPGTSRRCRDPDSRRGCLRRGSARSPAKPTGPNRCLGRSPSS